MTRYLTKLCDQLVCLLSSEHSQAIVWGDEADDLEDASTDSDSDDDSDRLYDYTVAKMNEQEENVIARQGFTVRYLITHSLPVLTTSIIACCKMNSSHLVNHPLPANIHTDPSTFSPKLLHGETMQGFMTAHFRPASSTVEKFSHDHQSAAQIRLLL
jgi:hypothetical protein